MMRIQHLDLAFFGHFTNRQFDFGNATHAQSDFHLIYGPNEAGKTTFMEAWLRLLYGFLPRNEPYAFRHGRENLHVSATVSIDGEPRIFHRKPTRQKSLQDAAGNALPEAALQAHLGGLTMDDYRKLLCIDDGSIEAGGEEIVASKGDIGTLLFSAAAGISDLWQVLEAVREQADNLYRKRASKTRMAELRKTHAALEKQIKELDVPATRLQQFTDALGAAKDAECRAMQEHSELADEQKRLDKQLRAMPQLIRLDELEGAIAAVTHYPSSMAFTTREIMDMLGNERMVTADITRLDEEHALLAAELEKLQFDPAHLQLESVLDDLNELHSRHVSAELDLENTREELESVVSGMSSMVRDHLHAELDPIDLLVDTAVIDALKGTLEKRDEAAKRVAEQREALGLLQIGITSETRALQALYDASPAGAEIADILTQYDSQSLSVQYQAAREAISTAELALDDALDALTIKGQHFSALPSCTMTNEEAEELVEQCQKHATTLAAASSKLKAEQQELAALMSERKQLEAVEGLVSDAQTSHLRDARETAWQAHAADLSARTAAEFEATMRQLDHAMEGRLANASDLARLRELYRQSAQTESRMAHTNNEVRAAEQNWLHTEQTLAAAMRSAGVNDTVPPKAALAWIRKYHETVSAKRNCQRVCSQYAGILDKAQALMQALSEHIPRQRPSLEELLRTASTMVSDHAKHDRSIQASRQKLAQAEDERTTGQATLAKHEKALTLAQRAWEKLVQESFPVAVQAPRLEFALNLLTRLRESNVAREALVKSVAQMQRDQQLFGKKLAEIINNFGLDGQGTTGGNHHLLQTLSTQAGELRKQKETLEQSIRQKADARNSARERAAELRSKTTVIAGLFDTRIPCTDLRQLHDAVEKTHEAMALRDKQADLQGTLLETLGVSTLEQARQLLAGLDQAALHEKRDTTEAELEAASKRYTVAIETRAHCEHQLASITGDGQVAQLVEQRTTIELEMSEVALDYLKLSLGHRLAERAIKRFRDTHRSTMLEATEQDFARLTDGNYMTLLTQTDGKTEALLALDKHGTPKRADQMSKGTRFQLYLALRAAAYDQLSDQGTCLPFICDDIFETFDEDRTRAACSMMERIGQRGQAIYLTHHRHVVDLAREMCPGRVQVHSL